MGNIRENEKYKNTPEYKLAARVSHKTVLCVGWKMK